jgi:predicted phosphodiesterase
MKYILIAYFLIISLGSQAVLADSFVYIREGDDLSYFKGETAPPLMWNQNSFTPGVEWIYSLIGFGIGYGDGDDNTILSDMIDGYLTVYVRSSFNVGSELNTLTNLIFEVRFDDGFIAYLNGVEIARSHVPQGPITYDTNASGHDVTDSIVTIELDPSILLVGENLLAVEVHNSALDSSDLSFIPALWGYNSPPIDAQIIKGPWLGQLERRSVMILWETDLPAISRVTYGKPEAFDTVIQDDTEKTHHEIVLENLHPASEYQYRVDSSHWPSRVGQFRTETDIKDPYRFVVFGDTRSNHDDHRSVVNEIVLENPAFVLHTGDLVGDGESESDWSTFFEIEDSLIRNTAIYPCLGNHEADGVRYLQLFSPPHELSPITENYYAFTFATSGFLVLDLYLSDFSEGSVQYDWLQSTLQSLANDPAIHRRFVFLHHGPYDSGPHGSEYTVRSDLTPLFQTYGVDIVFSGHDHTYERSTVDGIKYVVTGGGGAPLYNADGDWWTEVTEAVLHYVLMEINGPLATFTARRLDGSILDQFVIGDDARECEIESDCSENSTTVCEDDEEGEWVCIHGGCVWNCSFNDPDAKIDAGVDVDTDSDADSTTPETNTQSGCSCHHGNSGNHRNSPFIFLIIGISLMFIRKVKSKTENSYFL